MTSIRLNPRNLLGFKIIAGGESATVLHSPKIGGKGCLISSDAPQEDRPTVLRAKVGGKLE